MSEDIWHFPSEAPAYCFLCVFENSFDGEVHCGHYNPVKKQFCSTEGRYEINQVQKYCDLLHLLDCEQELIRARKALDYAIDVIQKVAKMSDKLSREYGETLVEQLDNIQAYCWQEGYVLTHEEDLERAITALEQKE